MVSVDPPSVMVKLSPPIELEVVEDFVTVTMMEGRELEVIVVDVSGAMLEVGGLELEVTEVVVAVLGGRGLEMGVAGGTFGNVMFRAGHPKDPASRRTGQ